jgi:ankyrin repeat protein
MALTPLFRAVESQDVELARELLLAGANVREPSGFDAMTPLRLAVHLYNADIVDLLLEFDDEETPWNADVHELNASNATFLHLIAYPFGGAEQVAMPEKERRLTDVARLLIHHGVDVSARDDTGFTALQVAARHCHIAMVRAMLDCPDLNPEQRAIDGLGGQTAEDMVAALLLTRVAIAIPGPVWTAHIDATREILAMLRAEPERRTQQRRVAFAMALHPRLGVASPVKDLEPGLVRMVLESP